MPIRESLRAGRSRADREEIVRFYAHFGGDIATAHARQPDHAAIELEIMHLLCHREMQAQSTADAFSCQLAQLDIAERQLVGWLPSLPQDVNIARPDGIYARLVSDSERQLARVLAEAVEC